MSTRSARARLAWAALLAAACAGCIMLSQSLPPPGWLGAPGPGGPGRDGYGAWAVVRTGYGLGDVLAGELIVCREDSVWVLTGSGLQSRPLRRVYSVRVYKAADQRGHVDDELLTRPKAAELRPWARFPQGLPPGLEPAALRPKPLPLP